MAFYVELQKISETELSAQYKFFMPVYKAEVPDDNIGIAEIDKSTGEVVEIKHALNDKNGLMFKRAAGALIKYCWQENTYLDKTCWAS